MVRGEKQPPLNMGIVRGKGKASLSVSYDCPSGVPLPADAPLVFPKMLLDQAIPTRCTNCGAPAQVGMCSYCQCAVHAPPKILSPPVDLVADWEMMDTFTA